VGFLSELLGEGIRANDETGEGVELTGSVLNMRLAQFFPFGTRGMIPSEGSWIALNHETEFHV
jgi:hypothetical protein